jgi:hypothetical protein
MAAPVLADEDLAAAFAANPDLKARNPEVHKQLVSRLDEQARINKTAKVTSSSRSSSNGPDLGRTVTKTWQVIPAAGKSSAAQAITRLIVALGAGLIAMEVISYFTGWYFSFDSKQTGSQLKGLGTYIGLYPGQLQPGTSAAAAQAIAQSVFPNSTSPLIGGGDLNQISNEVPLPFIAAGSAPAPPAPSPIPEPMPVSHGRPVAI